MWRSKTQNANRRFSELRRVLWMLLGSLKQHSTLKFDFHMLVLGGSFSMHRRWVLFWRRNHLFIQKIRLREPKKNLPPTRKNNNIDKTRSPEYYSYFWAKKLRGAPRMPICREITFFLLVVTKQQQKKRNMQITIPRSSGEIFRQTIPRWHRIYLQNSITRLLKPGGRFYTVGGRFSVHTQKNRPVFKQFHISTVFLGVVVPAASNISRCVVHA